MISLSASCCVASGLALTGEPVGCSRLMGRVFPLIRLPRFGVHIHLSFATRVFDVTSLCFLLVLVGCPREVHLAQ